MTISRAEAIHEAGHAVVADALGLHVFCIEPHERGPVCGVWAPEKPSPIDHFVLAAHSLGGGAATLRDGGAFTAAEDDDADAALCRASWLAQSIVNDRWPVVLALAAHVEERGGADEEAIAGIFAAYRRGASRVDESGALRPKETP